MLASGLLSTIYRAQPILPEAQPVRCVQDMHGAMCSGVESQEVWKVQVGASNELPESEELDALFDRFLIRRQVAQVSSAQLGSLARLAAGQLRPAGTISSCALIIFTFHTCHQVFWRSPEAPCMQ